MTRPARNREIHFPAIEKPEYKTREDIAVCNDIEEMKEFGYSDEEIAAYITQREDDIDAAWKEYEIQRMNDATAPYGWDYETMIGE